MSFSVTNVVTFLIAQAAVVNMNVFNIVSTLPRLKQFDWGVACEADTSGHQSLASIPFLSTLAVSKNSEARSVTDYMTVNQLMQSLCSLLPETKIRVLRVPVVTSSKSARFDSRSDN